MKVQILFYGQAVEVAGQEKGEVTLNDNPSLLTVVDFLFTEFPELSSLNLKFAVNNEFVSSEYQLKNGDEVVVMPPFAGG